MLGTIIITGASGPLVMPAVDYLGPNSPDCTLVLTVHEFAVAVITKVTEGKLPHTATLSPMPSTGTLTT